jgi:vacuolar-type H+-ATPase subunit I/STV1
MATTSHPWPLRRKDWNSKPRRSPKWPKTLQQLHNIHENLDVADYQQHVMDYVTEWEQVVKPRIDKELSNVRKLQQDRLHYEKKVDTLRRKVNQAEQKGKEVPEEKLERLQRNEQKLKDSFDLHERRAGKLLTICNVKLLSNSTIWNK